MIAKFEKIGHCVLKRGRGWFGICLITLCSLLGSCTSTPVMPESDSPPATSSETTTSPVAVIEQPPVATPVKYQGPLRHFYQALQRLESNGTTPVNILHLGDSHSTSDKFSGHLRYLFQQRFGSAGRGMLPVGQPFSYFRPTQVKVSQVGPWRVSNSFKTSGHYGLSGFITASDQPTHSIHLELIEGQPFEEVVIEFLRDPNAGTILVQVDNRPTWEIDTNGDSGTADHDVLTIPGGGHRMTLSPKGDGTIKLLSWHFRNNHKGILYHSHAIAGTTINIMNQWNPKIIAQEMVQLKPDLIIIVYGTNEGFNDHLKASLYEKSFREKIALLQQAIPQDTSIVIVGPPDAQRLPGYCSKKIASCHPLDLYEIEQYSSLLSSKNSRLCRWHSPPMLNVVREIQRRIAIEQGYFFWDWSEVMGNVCGTHLWSTQVPAWAARDHVHLTGPGYQYSAESLFNAIMKEYHF